MPVTAGTSDALRGQRHASGRETRLVANSKTKGRQAKLIQPERVATGGLVPCREFGQTSGCGANVMSR